MVSRNSTKKHLVIRSSPEIHGERTSESRKKRNPLLHEFDALFSKIHNLREWTKNLIKDSVALVSTENDMDIKSYLSDSEKKHLGKTALEILGMDMVNAAKRLGAKGGRYEKVLLTVGECERRLGTYGRDFVVDVCSNFIRPLKYFLDVELNKLLEEKEMLTSRKIDYDYHVRQTSNGKADKNTYHKFKMAEMALEFQYIHAKEMLKDIEVSECQVGHLSDLVNVQSVYHQKCLAELEKLKSELQRMCSNASPGTANDQNSAIYSPTKTPISKPQKIVKETHLLAEMRPSCIQRLENHSTKDDKKTPDSVILHERSQNTNRNQAENSLINSSVVGREESVGKECVLGGSNTLPDLNKRSGVQCENALELKLPRKARSSNLPSTEDKRTRLEKIPEDPRHRPPIGQYIESSQECIKHQPKPHKIVKPQYKSSPANPTCHHHSGDHSGGNNDNKEDYSSDDSTTSKETHVIPLPVRTKYRRDVGKMFFTPCKELE